MNNIRLLLIALSSFLISQGCNERSEGYVITGNISGIEHDTVFLREYKGKGVYITHDSALIENGSFRMSGSVEYPKRVILNFAQKRGGMTFWIENSDISITADADSLYNASVTGSVTDDEYEASRKALDEYDKAYHDTYRKLSAAKKEGDEEEIRRLEDLTESALQTYLDETIKYIKSHPGSYINANLIKSITYYLDGYQLEELINSISDDVASIPEIIDLKDKADMLKRVAIGQRAPDFEMTDQDGNSVRLYDLLEECELLLLDFWASWCGPCRRENPNILEVYNKYKDSGFDVLGLALDRDRESWLEAIEKDDLPWTQVSDLSYWDCPVASQYAVTAIPTSYLIDKNGIIIGKNLRGTRLEEKVKSEL